MGSMARGRYYYNSSSPLTNDRGLPSGVMAAWMRKISTIAEGIAVFIGENGDGQITADEVAQGVEQRIEIIANRVYTYNANGTVSKVEKKDKDTGAVISTKEFTYDADAKVDTKTETTNNAVATESFSYTGDQLDSTVVGIVAL